MPFASGSISFARFAVVGNTPDIADEDLLQKFADNKLLDADGVVPDDVTWGWCGGRHVLDGDFSFESNVVNDCLHVGLRVDTHRPPGDLKRAYTMIEEQAAAADGFLSKAQKSDARDAANRRLDDEKRDGRFRRSRMTPVLWDMNANVLYGPTSYPLQEKLFELFDRTLGLSLVPLTSGNLALRRLEETGRRRSYEDARPTAFVTGPQGEGHAAEYPWTAKGPQAKDFLGNEFLTWLWWTSESGGGGVETKTVGRVEAMIDRSLDLDCCYGVTGRDAIRGDGPSRTPEARHALRVGKVPRKLGLVLDGPAAYSLTLSGESLNVGSLRLPDVEDAESPRVVFEERINLLRDFGRTLDGLFDKFLDARAGGGWPGTTAQVRDWIARGVGATRAEAA